MYSRSCGMESCTNILQFALLCVGLLGGLAVVSVSCRAYEEETNGVIPFLDLLVNRQPDKTVKIQVYRKPTHTDQYLLFQSHHPIHHKSGVVRTLMDRKDTLVSTEDDKEAKKSYTLGMH